MRYRNLKWYSSCTTGALVAIATFQCLLCWTEMPVGMLFFTALVMYLAGTIAFWCVLGYRKRKFKYYTLSKAEWDKKLAEKPNTYKSNDWIVLEEDVVKRLKRKVLRMQSNWSTYIVAVGYKYCMEELGIWNMPEDVRGRKND